MYQKEAKISLYTFAIASITFLIAKILDMELLELLVKPIIIPSIFFYYLLTKKVNLNFLFSFIFLMFFIGDMMIMVFSSSFMSIILIPFMTAYVILIKFSLEDINFKIKNKNTFLYSIILFGFLSLILYYILDLPVDKVITNNALFFVYGLLLISLVTISTYIYLNNSNFNTLNLLLMAISMLVSDLLYCINEFIFSSSIIDGLNLIAQFISYFLIIEYFNSRVFQNSKLLFKKI